MSSWKRPENVPFPTVWHKFKARDVDSDALIEYRVQDMTEEDFDRFFDHMKNNFLQDEVMNNAMELWKDEDACRDLYKIWKEMVKQRVSLACFRENSDELVGGNLLYIAIKGAKDNYDIVSPKFKQIAGTMDFVLSQGPDVQELYKVDKHLGAFGLSVDRKYRGRGIATEIILARNPMCKALGIGLTSNVFTGEASQGVAKKAGWEENFSISYEEIAKNGFTFPKPVQAKAMKVMSYKID